MCIYRCGIADHRLESLTTVPLDPLADSGAPHRCYHARPERYLHQDEWQRSKNLTRCECVFSKAECKVQENIGKKAWYRSHHSKKAAKRKSVFSASASLYDAFGQNSSMHKDWGYAALIEYGGK